MDSRTRRPLRETTRTTQSTRMRTRGPVPSRTESALRENSKSAINQSTLLRKRQRETDSASKIPSKRPAHNLSRSTVRVATTSTQDAATRKNLLETLNKKVSELESNSESMKESLEKAQKELTDKSEQYQQLLESSENVSTRNASLLNEVSSLKQICEQSLKSHSQLESLIHSTEEQFTIRLQEQESKYQLLEMTHDTLKVQHEMLLQELERARDTISINDSKLSSQNEELSGLEMEFKKSSNLADEQDNTIKNQKEKIAEQLKLIATMEQQSRDDEMLRRKLHNTIQELKGNIRVFVRVRPLLGEEKENHFPYEFPDANKATKIQLLQDKTSSIGKEKEVLTSEFEFDKVFNPGASQTDVFKEISALVQSALDGYNVCIFTYGQTGSGKTFTMEGPKNPNPETEGMIPRAVQQIFEYAESLSDKGWSYSLTANYLEIYNETIRDLLSNPSKSKQKLSYKIHHQEQDQTTNVVNLSYIPVTSSGQVHDLLNRAARNRATAKTEMNERSSRSHSVFQLRMNGTNSVTGESATGLLNLVDLAGSERLKDSKATGDRLKETQNINASLSVLGRVISSLASKGRSIPYRDSKLTWLLRYSLSGNSKTLMFVNISPSPENLKESVNSLRFAKEVNSCNIGTARKAGKRNVK